METIHINLDKLPTGSNHARIVPGRAVAQNWERLGALAKELHMKPLQSFLVDSSHPTTSNSPWFSAEEAAQTINRLLSRVPVEKVRFENVRLLIRELGLYENILQAASSRGSRFRFIADWQEIS